jgi:DNA invertase Pin-like site-specific DNA recombinase
MSDNPKVQTAHLQRWALVYIRQSTAAQVAVNRESTERQYRLRERAVQLGWPLERIKIIDEDLAHTASGLVLRQGFTYLTSEVALGHAGLILSIEVSRVARNNADWYRLLDLCGVTDTLIGDEDGLYHPSLFNDRLLLGLKGTMAEAELHVLRARLDGGIRNKAARGELRRGLPVGLVWGESDGEFSFIRTRRSPARCAVSLKSSRSSIRPAACGSGCAPKGCRSHINAPMAKSSGSSPPTPAFITC